MFLSRRRQPPLTSFQRVDLELLMRRNIETLGVEFVRNCPIVIHLDELNLDHSGPGQLLESTFDAVRQRLPAMHQPINLLVRDGEDLGLLGSYQTARDGEAATITIASELCDDPLGMFMELSFQYSSHYWQQFEHPAALDHHPRTTHLLPICCGLGILASDASLRDRQWSQAGYSGWSISRSGYYTAGEIGYAMALLGRSRREEKPTWINKLRLDSQVITKQAYQHFDQQQRIGQELLFDAQRIPNSASDQKQLADWLAAENPDYALAAAYALCKHQELSNRVIDSALQASRSGDPNLVCLALQLFRHNPAPIPAVLERVNHFISNKHPEIARAAVVTAHAIGIPLNSHQRQIARLLDIFEEDPFSLLEVVADQGVGFASFEPQLCKQMTSAIRASDHEARKALIACLRCVVEDPRRAIESRIRSDSIRNQALHDFDAVD